MRLCRPELSLALFTLGCSPFNGGLCDVMAGAISGVIPFNDDDDDDDGGNMGDPPMLCNIQ